MVYKHVKMTVIAVIAVVVVIVILVAYSRAGAREAIRIRARELWTEHTMYTREFLLCTTRGLSVSAVKDRLMSNQDDLGSFYGELRGKKFRDELRRLAREHISLVAGLTVGTATLDSVLENGESIAQLFGGGDMREHMREHLDLTIREYEALRAGGSGIPEYDQVYRAAMRMSDWTV